MYWKEGSTVLLVLAKYFQIFKNDSKQYFINNGWFLVVGRSLNNRNILESGISVTKFNFSLSILFSGSPQIEYWLRFQSTTPFWQHQSQPEIEGNWREGSNLPKFLTNKMGFCTTVHSLFNINFVITELCQFIIAKTFSYQQTYLFITR